MRLLICLLKHDFMKCFIPSHMGFKRKGHYWSMSQQQNCWLHLFCLNPAGGYERPRKLKANWLKQHVCWLHCCRYLPSLLISQLRRVVHNFSASSGLRGEKTHSNLCIYIIGLSCLKGPFQVRPLCQSQHLESLKSPCLRHLVGNYLRALATFLWPNRKWCPSRSEFLALRIFALSLVLWSDIDSKQDRSASCNTDRQPQVKKQSLVQVWFTESPPGSFAAAPHCV